MTMTLQIETEYLIRSSNAKKDPGLFITDKGENVCIEIGANGDVLFMNKIEFIENMNEVLALLNGEK